MAQDIADDLSFFEHLHPFAYVLLVQNWVWSYYAVLKIRSNAELVCNEQTVMIRVAGDIQSSSRRNSGSRLLVLKPLVCSLQNWLTFFSSSKTALIFSSFFCLSSLSRCSNENGCEWVLLCGSSGLNTLLKSGRGWALICRGWFSSCRYIVRKIT